MGSKVSGKMAAATRVVQVVRPHAPLIKFPDRVGVARPNVQEALKLLMASVPQVSPSARGTTSSSSSTPPPDSLSAARDLPLRYRRTAITLDEMEYIQRGGPE